MFASLPMYDWPQLRDAHTTFWNNIHIALSENGIQSPKLLTKGGVGLEFWKHPEMVFSQTCGLPYRKHLQEKVQLVGTPDFAVEGCPTGYYRSYLVVRKNDNRTSLNEYKDAVFALNGEDSQSGYAAARTHTNAMGFWFDTVNVTGSHLDSVHAVANGEADIASIDAVTWRLIEKYESVSANIKILEATEPTPGLPYITSQKHDCDTIFYAVVRGLDQLDTKRKNDLGIQAIVKIPASKYIMVPTP